MIEAFVFNCFTANVYHERNEEKVHTTFNSTHDLPETIKKFDRALTYEEIKRYVNAWNLS